MSPFAFHPGYCHIGDHIQSPNSILHSNAHSSLFIKLPEDQTAGLLMNCREIKF